MKKILLVPLMAMSLLTACDFQQATTISIKEWLTDINEDAFTYFSLKSESRVFSETPRTHFNDYKFKVAEIIKNNISSIRLKKTTPDVEGEGFTYTLDDTRGNYNSLFLMVYENCIHLLAQGKKGDERISQYAEYSISKKESATMIEAVKARNAEMLEIYNNTNKEAEEETTLDNFYETIGRMERDTTVMYNEKEVHDFNLTLLEDVKSFDYKEVTDDTFFHPDTTVYYGLQRDFFIAVSEDKQLVRLTNYFDNPANPFHRSSPSVVSHTYKVSKDKIDAFVEKAKAL